MSDEAAYLKALMLVLEKLRWARAASEKGSKRWGELGDGLALLEREVNRVRADLLDQLEKERKVQAFEDVVAGFSAKDAFDVREMADKMAEAAKEELRGARFDDKGGVHLASAPAKGGVHLASAPAKDGEITVGAKVRFKHAPPWFTEPQVIWEHKNHLPGLQAIADWRNDSGDGGHKTFWVMPDGRCLKDRAFDLELVPPAAKGQLHDPLRDRAVGPKPFPVVNLCKDCRWYVDTPADVKPDQGKICGRKVVDLVTGVMVQVWPMSPKEQRYNPGSGCCGPEGQFWEPKA